MTNNDPGPMPAGHGAELRPHRAGLLVAGIVLVAVNLRASLTVVGPLLPEIQRQATLSSTAAGVLNTVPLLAFAAMSPFVPAVAHRFGVERSLFAALAALISGIVLRSVPTTAALFAGTALLGCAIAVGNVLLPALIKRDFPTRVGILTGVYTTTMGLVASIASGIAVPIAGAAPGGWRVALGCWAGLVLVAIAVFAPQLSDRTERAGGAPRARAPWRSVLAWQVTLFMGLQSLSFYVMIGWLPSILHDHGMATGSAGWLLFLYQVVALAASLGVPMLTRRLRDQRALAAVSAVLNLVGYAGLALYPAMAVPSTVLAGLGSGACLVLALSFLGLRAPDSAHAAALSGMAQSIGYLVAAAGPLMVGALHGVTGSWTPPLLVMVGVAIAQALFGFGAGRNRHI